MDANFRLSVILSAINQTGGAFGMIEKSASNLQSRFDKTKQAANNLFSIGSAASIGITGWAIKQGMELENTKIRMEVFLGSAQKAKVMLAELNDFANLTPYSNAETYNAANFLLPYFKDAKELRKELMMISDVSSGINAPFNEMAEKYSRFKAQDTLHMQDIYELTGPGFNIEYIAKALGVAKNKIQDLSKDGAIHFSHVQKAFQLATSEGGQFVNMTDRMSKSTSGRLSTALGTAQYALSNLTIKLSPSIISLTNSVIPMIDHMAKWVELNPQLAETLAKVLVGVVALYPISQLTSLVYNFGATAFGVVSKVVVFTQALSALKAAQLAGNMSAWYSALERYGAVGNLAAKALNFATIEQLGFNAATLANPYVLAAAGIVALAGAVYLLGKRYSELSDVQKLQIAINDQMKTKVAEQKGELKMLFDELQNTQEGSAKWNETIEKIKTGYSQYLGNIDLEKKSLKELPGIYDEIAAKMDMIMQKQAMADLKKADYAEMAKRDLDVANLKIKGDNIFDKLSQNTGGELGALFSPFSNKSKIGEKLNEKADLQKQIALMNNMEKPMDIVAAIKAMPLVVTSNLIVDGKKLASVTDNAKRVEDRSKFDNGK